LKDLGTLPGYENASYARGINNSSQIVGDSDSADQKRAFVYSKGHLVQLDTLAQNLNEAGFASLDVAYGINNKGWIVGYGTTTDNLTAAFVAVPERSRRSVGQQMPAPPPQVSNQQQLRPQEQDQGEGISGSDEDDYDVFYSKLSPEGSWVEAGNYGYCFRPRVAADWRPYEDGHWVWTDRGWYWDSNERFGWATYHYGRWVQIGGTGWCWAPGYQWAPAWVSWRESDDHVGWAPLPPEADVSAQVPISSWSDSYYGVGPAAYTFIRYSDWSAPSYAQYVEPPTQNVQIISQTKNVTNIVTNNTVINNYGPPVQTISAKTQQNIQQVKLAVNPATGPNASYGQTLRGNQLNVVAPPPVLKPVAKQTPPVQTRLAHPVVEKGWQGVKPADAAKLKKTIAEQNPPPKGLPKPTPVATPQILKKGQIAPSPTGSPVIGQKQTPPNLVKPTASPGEKVPTVNATPGGSPNAPTGKKFVPPNLIGVKPTGTPGASPAVKPTGAPGASPAATGGKPIPPTTPGPMQSPQKPSASGTVPPGLPGGKTTPSTPGPKQSPAGNKPSPTGPLPGASPSVPKSTPPNLAIPKASATPSTKPAATPASKPGAIPPGPVPSATPRVVATAEKKSEPAPTPTPQSQPTNLATPKPAPASIPNPTPQVAKPTATPNPPPISTPKPQPQIKAPAPTPQPQAKAPAPKPQPQAKAPAPKPQPQAKAPAPKPQPQAKQPPKGSPTPAKK
jgi:probable HAF family extracellular repeat protein